jgi:hypothetical protein
MDGVDWIVLAQDMYVQVVGSCEHGNFLTECYNVCKCVIVVYSYTEPFESVIVTITKTPSR